MSARPQAKRRTWPQEDGYGTEKMEAIAVQGVKGPFTLNRVPKSSTRFPIYSMPRLQWGFLLSSRAGACSDEDDLPACPKSSISPLLTQNWVPDVWGEQALAFQPSSPRQISLVSRADPPGTQTWNREIVSRSATRDMPSLGHRGNSQLTSYLRPGPAGRRIYCLSQGGRGHS